MIHIISGRFRNQKLQAPAKATVRPTAGQLRAAVFNICQHQLEGARVLDLFAGSGAMGLEALSRGASHASFVEQDRSALACIRQNIEKLGVREQSKILAGDAIATLQRLIRHEALFDLIYIDPPYAKYAIWKGRRTALAQIALSIVDESRLLAPDGVLFIETAKSDLPQEPEILQQLQLLDCRTYGSTALRRYQHKTS